MFLNGLVCRQGITMASELMHLAGLGRFHDRMMILKMTNTYTSIYIYIYIVTIEEHGNQRDQTRSLTDGPCLTIPAL